MILGPDGKPARPSVAFKGIQWINDHALAHLREVAANRLLMDLRESCGVPSSVHGAPIGNTITVKMPPRFTQR